MSATSSSSSSSSQFGNVEDIRSVKSVRIDVSPKADLIPRLEPPPQVSPPPRLSIHLHLSPTLNAKCPTVPHPTFKPKGPRSQPHKNITKSPEPQPHTNFYNKHDEYNIPTALPPRKTVGLYGDEPRLPSHRPSRYISEYACNGDRFAHLAPFQKNKTLIIDRHASVDLATMGLERFTMEIEGPERRKAGVLLLLGVKAKQSPSATTVQFGLVTNGLRSVLANFRARFGVGTAGVAREKESSIIEAPAGGSCGHLTLDEAFPGWIAP
ncbi:hypothetical protein FRC12_001122 [Ceratobasidium sp. 428]|nr:hypothetical protein FRC12_001122 [Ceratobasidium sp. 428]